MADELIDKIEPLYRGFESDKGGMGAVSVFRVLTPGWRLRLAEGHDPSILAQDIEAVKLKLDEMVLTLGLSCPKTNLRKAVTELTSHLKTPRGVREKARAAALRSKLTDELLDLRVTCIGTGFDDPGSEVVNGFRLEEIEAELEHRGALPK